jgi:hypothetical protein
MFDKGCDTIDPEDDGTPSYRSRSRNTVSRSTVDMEEAGVSDDQEYGSEEYNEEYDDDEDDEEDGENDDDGTYNARRHVLN